MQFNIKKALNFFKAFIYKFFWFTNLSKDSLLMNENIVNYLNIYIKKKDIHFATLLNGEWGTGKTYFIKDYIDKVDKNNDDYKVKFVYITLFGMKNIESVNESIFQQFHPLLGSKTAKIATNFLKGALKLGVNFDIDSNGKNEIANIDLSKTEFMSYFRGDSKKQAVFIFDDFERTDIPIGEILGLINGFVEHSGAKVIIICNEKEIKDDDEIYKKFKEKIVNRSFNVKADMESFWNNYIERYNILEKYLNDIKEVFEQNGNSNLRVLNQVTENFVDFFEGLDDKFKTNKEFIAILIKNYFSRGFSRKIVKKETEDNKENSITSKNKITIDNLFSDKTWCSILDSDYNIIDINNLISNFTMFKEDIKQESWVILWHHFEKGVDELDKAYIDTLKSFKNLEYSNPAVLIHVISLFVYFRKMGIGEIEVSEISNIVDEYIKKFGATEEWARGYYGGFNGTGLGYYEQDDDDIRQIVKRIDEAKIKAREYVQNKKTSNDIDLIKNSIINTNIGMLYEIFSKYETNPILDKLESKEIFEILIRGDGKQLSSIFNVVSYRYRENYRISGYELTYYLKPELSFLQELLDKFQSYYDSKQDKDFYTLKIRACPYLDNEAKNRLNRQQNKANCVDNIGILSNNLTRFCQI
jgi:Cdc6-like AAA superfamily ATPase